MTLAIGEECADTILQHKTFSATLFFINNLILFAKVSSCFFIQSNYIIESLFTVDKREEGRKKDSALMSPCDIQAISQKSREMTSPH